MLAAMDGGSDSGFETVEVPRRLKRWADKFTVGRISAIRAQLNDHKWLSDSDELCDGRTQAYYRAEALIELLVTTTDLERYELQRRTWPVKDGWRWAIKRRKE